MQNLLQAAV